jgi:hypothetical protein
MTAYQAPSDNAAADELEYYGCNRRGLHRQFIHPASVLVGPPPCLSDRRAGADLQSDAFLPLKICNDLK